MKLYHGTSTGARDAILRDGFHDGRGRYMTDREHVGVWLSDRLLDEQMDALLVVEIDGSLVEPYEWVNEPFTGYREFLVPAATLNTHAKVTAADWFTEYERNDLK
jgi:hypothetical protein